jgi:hypothetical protein
MRLAAATLAVFVLTATQAAAKQPLAPRTVFGITWNLRDTSFVELNALTLKPVSRSVPLGIDGAYLGRSPGRGMRAAIATGRSGDRVVFVDLARMKREGSVDLPCRIGGPVVWDDASRLLFACGGAASSILVVNPVTQKLRARKVLPGSLISVRSAGGMLAALLAPLSGIGPARLAVADDLGNVHVVALPGIRAGTEVLDPQTSRFRTESPALALDPSGRRAVVIPSAGPLVEVDLARLDVRSHALGVLTPAVARKEVEGTTRQAVWTWWDTIAVGGADAAFGRPEFWRPVGVTLIDAKTWTSTSLDTAAPSISSNGMSVFSWGATWDGDTRRSIGIGLTAYDGDGKKLFHLFGDEPVSLAAIAGSYAYVSPDLVHFRIVDTQAGEVLHTVRTARPTSLAPVREGF